MASNNVSGSWYGNRQGSVPTRVTFPFDFSQRAATASAVLLGTIRATADRPVQIISSVQIVTAFNSGTSDTITLGTTTTANELIPSGVTATAAGYYPSTTTRARVTTDTPVYLKYTSVGTAPTAGTGIVLLETYTENNKAIL